MKKDPYPVLYAQLFTCRDKDFGAAFSAIKTRLLADFLPPHDREGLFALALTAARLRREHIPPKALTAFAAAADAFLRGTPAKEQVDALLLLHEEPCLSAACEQLLLLIFREL